MRVTSKGQVTIPQAIREELGLHPGTDVEFGVEGDAATLRRVDGRSRGQALVAQLRERGGRARSTGMTTDEIMALTRGE